MGKMISIWLEAFRLRTLPLALSSILMGNFLAAEFVEFSWWVAILSILTTVFLQVLSNLANDYGDSENGADHGERLGPSRTVQSGKISSKAMKRAIYILVLMSFVSGVTLLIVAFGFGTAPFLWFLIFGIVAIIAAITYTMGKRPYGYAGLGDVSVLIFFGFLGVGGSYYLQTESIDLSLVLPSLVCGLFSVGVLNLNNIRDIDSDKVAGKYSIPVRIGEKKARVYHWILLIGGILSAIGFAIIHFDNLYQFIFLLSIPLFIMNGVKLSKAKSSEKIDPLLKQLAISTFIFVILFGISSII